jgi:PIN domain nuclease of toxin-antitoxin system
MKYLLDTHVVIWYLEDSSNLSGKVKEIIDDPENDIFIYSVSLWEIAIKMNLGKLRLDLTLDELLAYVNSNYFTILHIKDKHLHELMGLPFFHKDPFDRLIISAAVSEKLTVISIDNYIRKYDVQWIW